MNKQNLPNCINSPNWWQTIRWIQDPIEFQKECNQKYGDIFTINITSIGYVVIVANPQAVQEILSQDAKLFDVGRGNKIAEPILGKNSLMLIDGDRHQRERKLLMPPFHGERLQNYVQQISNITEEVFSHLQPQQPFIARSVMQKISLEVIVQIVFGLSKGERYQTLKPLLTDWTNLTDSPLRSSIFFFKFLQQDLGTWTPWGKMKQQKSRILQLLQAEIEDRRTQSESGRTDILSLMMAARDEDGQPMSDEELKDELLSMLFAGHETTATMLAWAFYEIHRHPDVYNKLLAEIDKLGANLSLQEISHLPYLSAVCQEILRMYPVIPILFPRIAKSSVKIGGYECDAGTTFMVSIPLVHYREDLYPNPQEFQPERFLHHQYSPAEYIPFGGGNRRCLGYALALLEIKIVLATVLNKYKFALSETKPVKIQRRGFGLSPAGGVKMVMEGKR